MTIDCTLNNLVHTQIRAYPGEEIILEVLPVDEQGFITTDIIQMTNSYQDVSYTYAHAICLLDELPE